MGHFEDIIKKIKEQKEMKSGEKIKLSHHNDAKHKQK
jgi:hypothetical protein